MLGSGIAFLDGTVVNVALPTIGRKLHADVAGLQWVISAYSLTLAALILLGGSLGDRYGRRRIYVTGVAGFAVCSLLCAIAPTITALVAARALQGVAAALLTPGSLAILQASFRPEDRMRAIGAWSGMIGVTTAAGPILGGWLVAWTWRSIFWLNLPLAVIVILLCRKVVPESRDAEAAHHLDISGVLLAVVGLAGTTYALTAWGSDGVSPPMLVAAVVGVASLVGFVLVERRERMPLVPMSLFASRDFSVVNFVTLVVYGALSGCFLFLAIQLQISGGYSPVAAGAATVPVSVLMLLLSERAGNLAGKIGARVMIGTGALVCAVGLRRAVDHRPASELPGPGAAGHRDLRARAVRAGRATDRHRAGRRTRPVRRHGERHQQRGVAHRRPAGHRRRCRCWSGCPARPTATRPSSPRRTGTRSTSASACCWSAAWRPSPASRRSAGRASSADPAGDPGPTPGGLAGSGRQLAAGTSARWLTVATSPPTTTTRSRGLPSRVSSR